jgi:hypothetical protein
VKTRKASNKMRKEEEETWHAPVGEDEAYAEAAEAEQEGPFPGDGAPEQQLLPCRQSPCCSPALVKAHLLSCSLSLCANTNGLLQGLMAFFSET